MTTGTSGEHAACSWCGRPLLVLFDLTFQSELFQNALLPGERLRLPLCQKCSQYGGFQSFHFFQLDHHGAFHSSPLNGDRPIFIKQQDDLDPICISQQGYRMHPMRTPYAWDERGTYLGGHPGWVQSSDYPRCPQCHCFMHFIAEHEDHSASGLFYAFLCADCLISTIGYQQD